MSAIAGVWRKSGGSTPAVDPMLHAMAPFGRSEPGIYKSGGIELGRRLTITVPEDAFDRQPYTSAAGSLCLAADLRLDNREEIAARIDLTSSEAASLADADMLMRAWGRFGSSCLDWLVGDYAFALWDATAQELLLVRDPVGLRPLFFHEGKDFFAFASMPSGLLALPEVPYALDEECLTRSALGLPGRQEITYFQGIRAVQPGEILTVRRNGTSRRAFWHPESIEPLEFTNPDDYALALRDVLERAVRSQLRSTGEVATQISAGLDSTSITATAARLLAEQGHRLTAFTSAPRENYPFPAPGGRLIDESAISATVAAAYGNIDHVVKRGSSATPFDILDRYFLYFQQPPLNLCNHVWLADIWQAAAENGRNVMLTGLLGNATISYRDMSVLRSMPLPGLVRESVGLVTNGHATARHIAGILLASVMPGSLHAHLKKRFSTVPQDRTVFTAANPALLKEWESSGDRASGEISRELKHGPDHRLRILDAGDVGPLNKGVLAGWGLDQRHPAIDRRVLETTLAFPVREFVRGGVPASVFRRAFADRLPVAVLSEKRRGLQAADWHEPLLAGRKQLLEQMEYIRTSDTARRYLDVPRLQQLAETLPASSEECIAQTPSLRFVLLSGIAVGHFIRRAEEGRTSLVADDTQRQQAL